jgi:site-specific recombinase XerD
MYHKNLGIKTMAINKLEKGWQVDVQPAGRGGKRFRKTFKVKAEAQQWEAWVKTQVTQAPEWLPERRDLRKLSALVDLWHQHHGVSLKANEDTLKRLKNLCEALGDPLADKFNAETFTEYRTKRLKEGITANTLNHEHAYMRAVFNELIRLGHWKKENPLKLVRAFKLQERELGYLNTDEIKILLKAVDEAKNHHVGMISRVCLETGARWSEAEDLRTTQVRNGLIQYSGKSGKNRTVPIRKELEEQLQEHHASKGNGERYFDDTASRWSFREAIKSTTLNLAEGQMTHVMRHTFASHFMMNGGNILALQKLLGHQSLTMTMRYAHLSPDHLAEARKLNPLAALNLC